jgi:penicillin-insensitive murein endopeptidase
MIKAWRCRWPVVALCAVLALGGLPAAGQEPAAKTLFSSQTAAAPLPAQPFGSYARGCLAGAQQLPETGPHWQAMRLGRNRNWGHPITLDFIRDLAGFAARQPGWRGLYIGDISQPRGGPMASGHASHQMGLDVDIWMLPPQRLDLSRSARENISSQSMRRANGAYVNAHWDAGHHAIIEAAAKDPRVARIFIFPGAKLQMCKDAKGNRDWLRKLRPWWGHHAHFHVRLACPKDAQGCENQPAPPAGDGCAEAAQWQADILNPPPPRPDAPKPKPKRALQLADLPASCRAVLAAP